MDGFEHGRHGWTTGALAGALVAATLMAGGCRPAGDSGRAGATASAAAAEPDRDYSRVVNVEVVELVPRPFTERIRVTGTVEANRDVQVAAEESGTIREVLAGEGSRVRAGEPIAKIDDRILRAQLEQMEAQAEVARETWERNRQLYEREKAISELQFVETRARAREAEASARVLRERLERTVIRAPFDGVLESRSVEVGSMVSPGTPVARVVQLDPVKVTGGVPERYSPDVSHGAPVSVSFDVLEGQRFEGRLSYVGSVIDPDSRTFRVELTVPNAAAAIKPEMVADIVLARRELPDAIVLPQEALVRAEEGFVAYTVEEDEEGVPVARARPVELGPAQRNVAVVESGLEPGDRVVIVGQARLADGDRVDVVEGRDGGR